MMIVAESLEAAGSGAHMSMGMSTRMMFLEVEGEEPKVDWDWVIVLGDTVSNNYKKEEEEEKDELVVAAPEESTDSMVNIFLTTQAN